MSALAAGVRFLAGVTLSMSGAAAAQTPTPEQLGAINARLVCWLIQASTLDDGMMPITLLVEKISAACWAEQQRTDKAFGSPSGPSQLDMYSLEEVAANQREKRLQPEVISKEKMPSGDKRL